MTSRQFIRKLMSHMYNLNILFKVFERNNGKNKSTMQVVAHKAIAINCLIRNRLFSDHEQLIAKKFVWNIFRVRMAEEYDINY